MHSSGPVPYYPEKQNIYGSGGGLPVVYDDQTKLVSNSVYKEKQSIINGACQIALAVICVVIHSISLGLEPEGWGIFGQGLWGGAMYFITGILGIMAGKKNTRCLIIAFFVFCILTASIISPGAAVTSAFGAAVFDNDFEGGFGYNPGYEEWRLASQIILLVMSVIQFGFAIWGCVICGMAVCSCVVWQTVPVRTDPPAYSGNYVSQVPVGQQVQGQGQQVYPGGGASSGGHAYQQGTIVYENYHSLQSKITGAAQIVIGILLIAFNATLIGLKPNGLGPVSHGFWGGGAFIFTGAFGVVAARTRTRCPVMTYMVSSVISIGLTVAVFIVAVIGIVLRVEDCFGHYSIYNGDHYCYGHREAIMAMHVLMVALAALEGVFAIWGCVLGAKVICGCCYSTNRVQFMPTGQQLLVDENTNYPVTQNPGFPAQTGPATMTSPYYPPQQWGPYAMPGSPQKPQPW